MGFTRADQPHHIRLKLSKVDGAMTKKDIATMTRKITFKHTVLVW